MNEPTSDRKHPSIDEDGHCTRCGLYKLDDDDEECPAGFWTPPNPVNPPKALEQCNGAEQASEYPTRDCYCDRCVKVRAIHQATGPVEAQEQPAGEALTATWIREWIRDCGADTGHFISKETAEDFAEQVHNLLHADSKGAPLAGRPFAWFVRDDPAQPYPGVGLQFGEPEAGKFAEVIPLYARPQAASSPTGPRSELNHPAQSSDEGKAP